MKLPKLRTLKQEKKKINKTNCKDKVELALKEIENLSQEAKNFFDTDDKKGKKNDGN